MTDFPIDFHAALRDQNPPSAEDLRQASLRLSDLNARHKHREKWITNLIRLVYGLAPLPAATIMYFNGSATGSDLIFLLFASTALLLVSTLFAAHLVEHLSMKFINSPALDIRTARTALAELNADDTPEACIHLALWQDWDPALKAYLNTVARLKRKPVMGEYLAAKHWMETTETRRQNAELRARAQKACARLCPKDSA